jgi:N-acyl-D-aspartate/D-glutamate deacylase
VDVLIRGGTVYDGSGEPGRAADVGVREDRIVFVGRAGEAGVVGRRVLEAEGLVVTPGFVDPHVHALQELTGEDRRLREHRGALLQGVTTVVVGNDGGGPVDVAATRAAFQDPGIGTNAAVLVGFGSVRRTVMGMRDGAPNPAELDSMKTLVDRAMKDGALGLSTGLFYAPQSFAETDEVVALAQVAARHGGLYDTHLRDESSYSVGLVGAVEEALAVGREAEVRVNIAHIKALGVDAWGKSAEVIERIREARAQGQEVTADQYPYEASGTSLGAALLPRWAQAGGTDSLLARIRDPERRPRLLADMAENLRRRNGPDALLVTGGPDESLRGRTLAEIAAARGADPLETALELIAAGGARVGSFSMGEEDIRAFMQADFVMTGSDGSAGHPRKFGAYARKIRRYVVEDPVLTLARMVEASTAQPARTLGLEGRGTLEEGAWADIAVFDPAAVRDRATFLEPTLPAEGMRWVLVNGVLAVDDGRATGALAGRALARAGSRPVS